MDEARKKYGLTAKALSDGPQSITPEHYYETMTAIQKLAKFFKEEGIEPLHI